MKISAGTVAPTLILLVVIGWLLYPHLEAPEELKIPKPATPEVARSLLAPPLDELPERNPFRLKGESDDPSSVALAAAFALVKSPTQTGSPTVQGQAAPSSSPAKVPIAPLQTPREGIAVRVRRLVETLRSRAERAVQIQADLRSKVDAKVKLSATSIHGRRRIAILNGKTYAQGEAIDWAIGIAGPILVSEVRLASVILGSKGARVEVFFPTTSVATGPPPSTPSPSPRRSTNSRDAGGVRATRP